MKALDFHPVFRTDVFIVCPPGVAAQYPNGTQWQVNPQQCLSDKSAEELATVLSDLGITVVQVSPTGFMLRFYPSSSVAGFAFPDGTTINAADLAMWWVRNDPRTAERMARLEAAMAIEEHAQAVRAMPVPEAIVGA